MAKEKGHRLSEKWSTLSWNVKIFIWLCCVAMFTTSLLVRRREAVFSWLLFCLQEPSWRSRVLPGDFPDGRVAKALGSHCRGWGCFLFCIHVYRTLSELDLTVLVVQKMLLS